MQKSVEKKVQEQNHGAALSEQGKGGNLRIIKCVITYISVGNLVPGPPGGRASFEIPHELLLETLHFKVFQIKYDLQKALQPFTRES